LLFNNFFRLSIYALVAKIQPDKAELKGREFLYLKFMMRFFYGNCGKKEENFLVEDR